MQSFLLVAPWLVVCATDRSNAVVKGYSEDDWTVHEPWIVAVVQTRRRLELFDSILRLVVIVELAETKKKDSG